MLQTPYTSEVLGQEGVFDLLKELHVSQSLDVDILKQLLYQHGPGTASPKIEQLTTIGVFLEFDDRIYLSPKGHRYLWLLNALNGGDLKETFRQLSFLDPGLFPYEIVTEGMTSEFIHYLCTEPTFRRVYICSPWIHIKPKFLRQLAYAFYQAEQHQTDGNIDFIVITQPLKKQDKAFPIFLRTFQALRRLGAEIVTHEKLHAKLYLREPGAKGGMSMAIVGSENLTSKRNIELGIRVTNDTMMLNKLVNYFFEIYSDCSPYEETINA